jgi:hypothetical protein
MPLGLASNEGLGRAADVPNASDSAMPIAWQPLCRRIPSQEWASPSLQKPDKGGVHELVLIGDAEDDETLALQVRLELLRDLVAMSVLHDKDDLRPLNELRVKRRVRTVVDSCRLAFNAWVP